MGTEDQKKDEAPGSFFCSFRFGLSVLGFIMFLHNNMQRVSMSVAIICMVNHTAVRMLREESEPIADNLTSTSASLTEVSLCGNANSNMTEDSLVPDGPFVWTKEIQGHILGAYFYGYLISQFPAGLLSERFGPKKPLTIFYALATVAMLFSPLAATVSPYLLIFLRILIGIGSGALFPCMHTMWSRWAPPLERSKLAGVTYAGCMAAAMVGLPLSGVLCQYGFSQGWDSIFYIIGGLSALVMIPWMILTTDTPESNHRISEEEKRYIVSSLKDQGTINTEKKNLPWLEVLKSGPVWAIIISNFCSDWGLYTLLTNIPTFLNEVLQFKIQSNGFFSALPFMGLWINMNVSPIIADKLRASHILSTTKTRKVFNSIGLLVPAVFLIGLGFVECTHAIIGVGLLTIGVTFSGCAYTGFLVNHMDIAPRYAGTLLGISNGLGAMSGFIAPNVAAALTPNQSRKEWQMVFFVASGVYVFGAIIYMILGSGSVQSWARDEEIPPEEIDLKSDQSNGLVVKVDQNGAQTANDVHKPLMDTKDPENGCASAI